MEELKKISLYFFGFYFSSQVSLAQKNEADFPFHHIEYINSEQGLKGMEVTRITQGQNGFMWFVTNSGLNRYDGYSFRSWSYDANNPNSPVTIPERYSGITENIQGILWFSHLEAGFYSFDPRIEKFIHYRHQNGVVNSLISDNARSIAVDKDMKIWIATDKGLDKFDPKTNSFTHYMHSKDPYSISENNIYAVLLDKENTDEDAQNDLWIINNMLGIDHLDGKTGKLIKHFDFPFALYNSPGPDDVNIGRIKAGMIWIGSNDTGIYGFNTITGQFIHIEDHHACNSSGHIRGLYPVMEDHVGNLWTVNDNNELVYVDRSSEKFYYYKINRNNMNFLDQMMTIFEDNSYKIWLSSNNGLLTIDTREKAIGTLRHFEEKANSVSLNFFFDIYRTRQSQLLIGAVPLNIMDNKTKTLSPFSYFPKTEKSEIYAVRNIYQDNEDIIWFSGDFGIVSYDPYTKKSHYCQLDTGSEKIDDVGFREIIQDKENRHWAVNNSSGLYLFDPSTHKAWHILMSLKADHTRANAFAFAFADSKGKFYLGMTEGGFVTFDPESFRYENSFADTIKKVFPTNEITTCFLESKNGLIWFGTMGRGIGVFDPVTENFKYFTEDDNLANNVVYSLVKDKRGRFWAGTRHGISCFSPHDNPFSDSAKITFRNYNSSDGLPLSQCNYRSAFCDEDGTLYFGTRGGGIFYFHPDSLIDNSFIPPVYITSFSLLNKPVTLKDFNSVLKQSIEFTKELVLSYKQNTISFTFAALNYTHPEKNKYSYMLEGYDKDWISTDASKRFATYTNLKPRKYIFKVKGTNNDGRWNEIPTELKIIITPPFWQTTWFKILIALTLASIVYAFYRYRIGQILLLQRMRNKIAADLHDDIGSTLNSIALYSELAKKQPLQRDYALDMIATNARKIIDSMSDIVWMINPKNDSFDKIIFRMRSITHDLLKAKKIDYLFRSDETLNGVSLPMGMRRNIYLIFKEALNNIIKYSNANRASIKMIHENENIILIISDNGVGFDVSASYNGNGINNMVRRAEEIGAKIKIESEQGIGTNLELNVKL